MLIAIIAAMDEEIQYIEKMLSNKSEESISNVQFITGMYDQKRIVILKSGIGKVNAAMATTILMENYEPTYVINTGTAGGVSTDLKVGDIVIADKVVHSDVDVTAFNYKFGQVPQLPPTFKVDIFLFKMIKKSLNKLSIPNKIGLVGTADSFMNNEEKIKSLKILFPELVAVEMEGAAIAQVCYQYEVPFILIRAISDIAGEDSSVSFKKFIDLAAKSTANTIEQFLLNV